MLNSNKWTMAFRPNPDARMRLFCIPYAGSGASLYRDWSTLVRSDVEVVGIQLPGRENRFSEPHLTSIDEAVGHLVTVLSEFSDKPYVLFGHSLGAILSFELTHALQKLRGHAPRHLVVSGTRAPHRRRRENPIHQLPDAEFLEEIKRFNGTPKALLQDAELMMLFTPLLRADFGMVENYLYQEGRLAWCPVTVLGGDQDDGVPLEDLQAWKAVCRSTHDEHVFPGGHFFIHDNKAPIVALVNDVLEGLLARPAHAAAKAPYPAIVGEETW